MANEKRLIDANALLKEIDGIHQRHYANSSYQFIHDFFLAMFRRIKNAPTVDAVVLPCKMGDSVWGIKIYNHGREVKQGVVHQMFFGDDMRLCICVKNVCRGEWGKNVFATKEEAERVLKND